MSHVGNVGELKKKLHIYIYLFLFFKFYCIFLILTQIFQIEANYKRLDQL